MNFSNRMPTQLMDRDELVACLLVDPSRQALPALSLMKLDEFLQSNAYATDES